MPLKALTDKLFLPRFLLPGLFQKNPLSLQERLVISPRFRRWAARFPLTRPIARRRTKGLFDLCAGFVYTQILQTCVDLRLFDLLAEGPRDTANLARALDLPPESMARLLEAACALDLVSRRRRQRWGLGPLGAAMVDNPGVAAMIAHHRMLYADLADPLPLLRGTAGPTQLARYWAYATASAPEKLASAESRDYTALMAASQPLVAAEILDAIPLTRHHCLLDIGGGDGSFLRAAARAAPHIKLILFDLPPVAAQAETRFAVADLSARATAIGGSFRTDPLPRGADIISLVRVVHDHDDPVVEALLRAAFTALPPGGTLLLAEPMADTPGAERMGSAYFGFYLLAMGSGRPRSVATLTAMLRAAGFIRIRHAATSTPLLASVLVAVKPKARKEAVLF